MLFSNIIKSWFRLLFFRLKSKSQFELRSFWWQLLWLDRETGTKVRKDLGHFSRNRERTCRFWHVVEKAANEWSKVRRLKNELGEAQEWGWILTQPLRKLVNWASGNGRWVFRKGRSKKKTRSWKNTETTRSIIDSHHPGVVAARACGSPSGNVERPLCICWLCPKTQVNLQIYANRGFEERHKVGIFDQNQSLAFHGAHLHLVTNQ